jgi:hypothetical protein
VLGCWWGGGGGGGELERGLVLVTYYWDVLGVDLGIF